MSDERRRLSEAAMNGVAADMSIYADWLEENRADLDLAHALRWCVKRGVRPSISPFGKRASWHRIHHGERPKKPGEVPALVFDVMLGGKRPSRTSRSWGGHRPVVNAYRCLSQALFRLKKEYEP